MNTSANMMPFKVCCIASIEEAQLAIRYGAHALGLVSAMPSGPGVIDESLIADIASFVRTQHSGIKTFVLTSLQSVDAIAAQHARVQTTTIQLCDALLQGSYQDLHALLPAVELVQVIHVNDPTAIAEAQQIAPQVDALLLDSGSPHAAQKTLGGTGRTHNWDISAAIVQGVSVPVYLAGGLRADNVAQAAAHVRPFALDICSGVRSLGLLDEQKLAEFARATS